MLTDLLDAALAQVQPAAEEDGVVRVVSINLLPGRLQLTYENDCGRHDSDWFGFEEPSASLEAPLARIADDEPVVAPTD
ncbi:MAG: hypothetical protein AB7Q29_16115 [Vicinamibacterales bacterium]